MSYREDYAEAIERYRPEHIRLLFIAEAPPAYCFHRLFYFTNVRNMDTLFLETMKVLYPEEVGFRNGQFLPGYSSAPIRRRKADLLARFQSEGYFLIDAHEEPMPGDATANKKEQLMRASLPHLLEKLSRLSPRRGLPVVLIGTVTYRVCAATLREKGVRVLNNAAIDHPARGGQIRFREKLSATLQQSENPLMSSAANTHLQKQA